jgi:hypothetical protein
MNDFNPNQVTHAAMQQTTFGPCIAGCEKVCSLALFDTETKTGICESCVRKAQHGEIGVTGEMLKLLRDTQIQ